MGRISAPATLWARLASARWPWLIYLPLLVGPWLWSNPPPGQWPVVAAAIILFLPLYLVGSALEDRRKRWAALGVLLLSFGLSTTAAIWSVFSIYAAAMLAETLPRRQSIGLIALFAGLSALVGLHSAQPLIYWAPGVAMMVLVGAGGLFNQTLRDKNRALLAAQDTTRQLAATAERERIGRDLHDLLGRTLTLISIKAELAARLIEQEPQRAQQEMRDVAQTARDALAEVRGAVTGMTAHLPRELVAAKDACAAAGIDCTLAGSADGIEAGTAAVLAMALREGVTNIVRHSGARHCTISIETQSGSVRLGLADDGKGGIRQEGAGLTGLRARVAAAGGTVHLDSDGGGTRLFITMPDRGRS